MPFISSNDILCKFPLHNCPFFLYCILRNEGVWRGTFDRSIRIAPRQTRTQSIRRRSLFSHRRFFRIFARKEFKKSERRPHAAFHAMRAFGEGCLTNRHAPRRATAPDKRQLVRWPQLTLLPAKKICAKWRTCDAQHSVHDMTEQSGDCCKSAVCLCAPC